MDKNLNFSDFKKELKELLKKYQEVTPKTMPKKISYSSNYNGVSMADLLIKNPEIVFLPMVIYNSSGEYDWIGASGSVYLHDNNEEEKGSLLVFSGN